jgi:hypothetical protein
MADVRLRHAALPFFLCPTLLLVRAGCAGWAGGWDRSGEGVPLGERDRRAVRPIEAASELDVELRPLVGPRRELVTDQTRRIGRLRDLLASIHPGLERAIDATGKTSLWLLSRYVTPAEIRRAGKARLVNHLFKAGPAPATADRAARRAGASSPEGAADRTPGRASRRRARPRARPGSARRRRVDILHAILRTREPCRADYARIA